MINMVKDIYVREIISIYWLDSITYIRSKNLDFHSDNIVFTKKFRRTPNNGTTPKVTLVT